MKKVLVFLLVVAAFVAGVAYDHWHKNDGPQVTDAKKKPTGYHCPMHPNFRSDKPGDCGICGMKLVPDDPGEAAAAPPAADRKVAYYRDPHNHAYRSDKPGLNPETGNELEPVYAGDMQSMPAGTVRITPEKQQLIGVRYGVAEYGAGGKSIRAAGRVAADETRIVRVQTKIEGWIEQVHVNFTGKFVEKDAPLLTIYSPEMLATQQEYLLALRSREILHGSPLASARESGSGLVEAARRRLQLWDLSDSQIAAIEKSGKPFTNVTLHSPISGHVTERNAFPKQRVTPENPLYTITDLSRVWVMADVYEFESAAIQQGERAIVTVSAYPGRRFPATVSYIQPQMDATTRTLRIRLELSNPELLLKPEMFVNVELFSGEQAKLTVPTSALLNSGTRQTVFVDRGNGYLEPRRVQAGRYLGDRVEILSGLKAGERIVTSGTFLVDSESQLKSAASGMTDSGETHQHD